MASWLLPFIPLVPTVSALVLTLFGRNIGRTGVGRLATSSIGACFVMATICLVEITGVVPGERTLTVDLFDWISLGSFRAVAAFVLDPLSSVLILVVTGVGFLVHVYSLGYMEEGGDPQGYFAYLNLLTAFMLLLVLAENLVLMFVGWEGVALCSYLLIGYGSKRKAAVDASMKAFLLNRIGDLGFLIGILMTFVVFGTVSFQELLPLVPTKDANVLNVIAILLFAGAMSKSAQVPLHIWLPDAVKGPPPVSALLQSSTIVAAGVYVVTRSASLYAEASLALGWMAAVGVVTAVSAAVMALKQYDIQRVLAYSTVSQLGYMFLACGIGAFGAAFFHLVTHALFKALLFLCVGSVVSATAGGTDIRRMGGLKGKLPITYRTFVIGMLALVGVPPFAGFFSENQILWSAFRDGRFLLWGSGLVGTFLTALYIGRLWTLVFGGRFRGDAGEAGPSAESLTSMAWPLRLLAAGSVTAGFIGIPHYSAIESHLAPYFVVTAQVVSSFSTEASLMLLNTVVSVTGLFIARHIYLGEPDATLPTAPLGTRQRRFEWPEGKYGVDTICDRAILRPLVSFSRIILWRGVDGAVLEGAFRGAGRAVGAVGQSLRLFQSGNLRVYLFALFAGALAMLGWLLLGARWVS